MIDGIVEVCYQKLLIPLRIDGAAEQLHCTAMIIETMIIQEIFRNQ